MNLANAAAVGVNGADALLPLGVVLRRRRRRPVVVGPLRILVLGVRAELEQIVLRDADVLEELPDGVRQSVGTFAAQLGGQIGERGIEADVRLLPIERRRDDLLPGLCHVIENKR